MTFPPVVYVGPSLDASIARDCLPDAQLMPPIQRGDLYKHRMLGFSFFVILDGVFYSRMAIPAREILDVIEDGATVLGASSMGAIRAAECWPAGMLGAGTIYRLFRSGALDSDDEVAVVFNADKNYRISSLALVNVRFAVARSVKAGLLDPGEANRIVASARDIFYAERNWANILGRAGIGDDRAELGAFLRRFDLKRTDAIRCLKKAGKLVDKDRKILASPRATIKMFVPNEFRRELPLDPLFGADTARLKAPLWEWLIVSGKVRLLRAIVGNEPNVESAATITSDDILENCLAANFPGALWDTLWETGELEILVYQFQALVMAIAESRKRKLVPAADHVTLAGEEIASDYGYPDWAAMEKSLQGIKWHWQRIAVYRDELSLAKKLRDELF